MDSFPKKREVARLDLPVLNLLDCICLLGPDETYERWFPLWLASECVPVEGKIGNFEQSTVKEHVDEKKMDGKCCIRLQLRWRKKDETTKAVGTSKAENKTTKPDQTSKSPRIPSEALASAKAYASTVGTGHDKKYRLLAERMHQLFTEPMGWSVRYGRLQLPSLSVSVIDSDKTRELVQLCVAGVEVRHYETKEHTEHLVNITAIQVVNSLNLFVHFYVVAQTLPREVCYRRIDVSQYMH